MKYRHGIGKRRPIAVGITGGIGSGKSAACLYFSALGATVLSADAIAKRIVDSDTRVKARIKAVFGDEIYPNDRSLNRSRMAQLIFRNRRLRQQLEQTVHPVVIRELLRQIREFKRSQQDGVLMIEAALVYEAKAEGMFDYIIAVDAPLQLRMERIVQRDRLGREEVRRRFRAQMSAHRKLERADFILQNRSDRKHLEDNCSFLYSLLTTLART